MLFLSTPPAPGGYAIGAASSSAIASTQVAYGDAANSIKGKSTLVFVEASDRLQIGSTSGSRLLLGTSTDTGNGAIQLAAHTTAGGGIGLGTDVQIYRGGAAGAVHAVASAGGFTSLQTGTGDIYFLLNRTGGTAGFATFYIPSGSTNLSISVGGTLALTADTVGNTVFANSVKTTGTGGVGYAAGAGGTVTQLTNRTTGVTLNKTCGQITTHNASLATSAAATFTVTNSTVAATDHVDVSIVSGAVNVKTDVRVTAVTNGTFNLTVHNLDGATAETGAIVINFAVIKSVTT